MTQEKPRGALIGAYGLFWERQLTDFEGFGPKNVPIFGVGADGPTAGMALNAAPSIATYVLYNDYGPVYTGISNAGLGQRLKNHHDHPPVEWTRYSWFAFGDVKKLSGADSQGWCIISKRSRPEPTNPEANVRELEALLIRLLGLKYQNQMQFQRARRWNQITDDEALDLVHRGSVTDEHFPNQWKRKWARLQRSDEER